MKISFGYLLLSILLMTGYMSNAQKVQLLGQSTERSILLRWAPDDALLWKKSNEYGYTVERYTVSIDGKIQTPAPMKNLKPGGFKPAPLDSWESYMDDDHVAIAAQTIYGEEIEVGGQGLDQIVEKSKEGEARFSYAIYAAERSVKAAQLSGLFFEDEEVLEGEKYLYKVYSNVPQVYMKSDTGFVYMGIDEHEQLPKIPHVQVQFDDKLAMVSWNVQLVSNSYSSFWVEKSVDGGDFKKTSEVPFVPAYKENDPNTRRAFIVDSLGNNFQKVSYRVLGNNAFGQTGPPSDIVKGHGLPSFTYAPSIYEHENIDDEKVVIKWGFPSEADYMMKSFSLKRVINDEFIDVITDIDPKERSIVDLNPIASNYYVIYAYDKYGRSSRSFPYFVQLDDSIPPIAPAGLTGRIDSTGRVFIDWEDNTESDLKGYYVFRSNFETRDFTQLPRDLSVKSEFVDSISVNNLTKKIYYKVAAIDKRANQSILSESLELIKPDKIPPVPAIITAANVADDGVLVDWQNSSSQDVAAHIVYRKSEQEANWNLVKEIFLDEMKSSFLDLNVVHGVRYNYTVIAVDENGLESQPSPAFSVKFRKENPYPGVTKVNSRLSRENKEVLLEWGYEPHPNLKAFYLYKRINDEKISLLETTSSEARAFTDRYENTAETISYYVIAQFEDGYKTGFEKEIKIDIVD